MDRQPNTQYVLSLSYGKDSIATLEAIRLLGYPLDRIVHAEIWATDTISADLPPMVEFKAYADKIIKERYGVEVEHICAMRDGKKLTYEKLFYHKPKRKAEREGERERRMATPRSKVRSDFTTQTGGDHPDQFSASRKSGEYGATLDSNYLPYKGFPLSRGAWCKKLKTDEAVWRYLRGFSDTAAQGGIINTVQYLGIAADEPERIARHTKPGTVLPLVDIGWVEAYCRQWCEENDLLSPIYHSASRGGCWFCHNQSMDQLRLLRKNYPQLWSLLLKWDVDSPVTFHSDGHTVHDIDKRIAAEEAGLVPTDRSFRWKMLDGLEVNG